MSEQEQHKIAELMVEKLIAKGYTVSKATDAFEALQREKAISRLLRKKALTPYEISKFQLVGKITASTIKNMVKDGRINELEETYKNNGKLMITRECVKRLRGD